MKKIISLLLVSVMLLSMSVMVGAAEKPTLTIPTLTTADATTTASGTTYYVVYINIDKMYTTSENVANGYNSFNFRLKYDDTKLTLNKTAMYDSNGVYYTAYDELDGWMKKDGGTSVTITDLGNGVANIVGSSSTNQYSILQNSLGNGNIVGVRFIVKAGATGKTAISFEDPTNPEAFAFACADGVTTHASSAFELVNGSINLGGEPVATTVKTFPKRFYEVDSKTLTTVGLILEGDDYNADTAVAGIYADGEAFEAAPIAGAEGKSYILVGLQGVTETSKINLGTATKAFVNLGEDDICGDEVTDYTSDAAEKVAGADDFKE